MSSTLVPSSLPTHKVLERTATGTQLEDLKTGQVVAPKKSGQRDQGHSELEPENENQPDLKAFGKVSILLAVTLPPLAMIAGLSMAVVWGGMSPWFLLLMFGGWMLTGLGITVGYHRLVAHRSFQTYGWIRGIWMAFGAMALEGCPAYWSAVHRKHHKHSDDETDPHTPHRKHHGVLKGLWFSHVGWMFQQRTTGADIRKYAPDLLKDPVVCFFTRTYLMWIVLSVAIPAGIGYLIQPSLSGILLGAFLGGGARIFWTHHITWSINSICHVFGSKPYQSRDESRNNFVFGILAMGEGWHNNHHAFPTSARHGLKWWQFDLSWITIRTLQILGLAWKVQVPSPKELEAKRNVSSSSTN